MDYKVNINYMKLIGAQVMSVDINGKKMNCVVIPCDWNGIKVTADKETGKPRGAYQNITERTYGQKYIESCRANHQGEEGYVAPSHEIRVSYPKALREAYVKRQAELLRADKEYMATNPTDKDIESKAGTLVANRSSIGNATPIPENEAPAFVGSAPAAIGTGAYVPPPAEVNPEDDLPF